MARDRGACIPLTSEEAHRSLLLQERLWLDTGLLEDGAQCAFGHIAGMIGNGGVAVGRGVVPDLVAAGGLAMKLHGGRGR